MSIHDIKILCIFAEVLKSIKFMKKVSTTLFLMLFLLGVSAQGNDGYGSGIKIKINEDGSKYLRVISWAQVWSRYTSLNEGSNLNGKSIDNRFDVGLRRARMLFLTQMSPKFLILAHFGINNQNAIGTTNSTNHFRPQLYIHDMWTEYLVGKGKTKQGMAYELSIGAGLHYWQGVSRLSNASTLNFLTLDAPITNWSTIEHQDQFARMLGIYAKGKIEKLDYRVAVNTPFNPVDRSPALGNVAANGNSSYNPNNNSVNLQGYFSYQFLDQESTFLPFTVGSYLGTKSVFNIGAGFLYSPDAMHSKVGNDTVTSAVSNFGVDVFFEKPLSAKKDAITVLATYFNYNFGKNFVRNIGIMNPAMGGGNQYPTIGTGQAFHAQLGYLLPKTSEKLRIQPYANATIQNWEGQASKEIGKVGEQTGWFVNGNVGCNWLIEGHHAKITTDLGMRPDFTTSGTKMRPTFTVQTMIYL